MKKDVCGRIARLALVAFALYGITFGALFLRGMYYVQPNADNWRLLPYIVPAARYEQCIYSAEWFDGQQERASVSISCMDAQGREIRGVTLHERDLLPLYSDTVYAGNAQTDYFKDWDNYGVQRIITDAQGRTVRIERPSGNVVLMQYDGESEEPSLIQTYDPQGVLLEQAVSTFSGNTRHSKTADGSGNVLSESEYMRDARGNVTFDRSTYWGEERRTLETSWIWEYDDADRLEICTLENGQVNRWWHDEQGREIKYEAVRDGDTNTFYHTYMDITRQ